MSIFVDKTEELSINIVVGESVEGNTLADMTTKGLTDTFPDAVNIEEHTIWFTPLDFGEQAKAMDGAIDQDGKVNTFIYRLNLMKMLIKKWTFKKDGKPILPSSDAIKSLNPIVAFVIGLGVERALQK